ncbi:hypothetical protein [Nocardia jiangxiensis]|uniref:hypothetical protein n=1 Tax=Nocardia jiangxiensis TaxID=282685 RepID=UPI0005929A7C|nr:hypothetical protein [Nocardia jiangxiensis]
MRAKKFAATALLAIGATGVTAGVVQARPVTPAATAIQGADHGVQYSVAPTADDTGVATTVAAGRFALAPDARSVTLTNASGAVVATVPLGLQSAAGIVGLTPRIANDGRTLTLTPQSASSNVVQSIDEADTTARKQYNAGVGALIGAGIGAVIGFFLGGVGALVTIPLGAGIGALIGYSTP